LSSTTCLITIDLETLMLRAFRLALKFASYYAKTQLDNLDYILISLQLHTLR